MPRPPFTEARRGKEAVNEITDGQIAPPSGHIRGEGLDVGGRRRQADEIEEKPPQERRGGSL